MLPKPLYFDVGIDPNLCMLAVHVRLGEKAIPKGWFTHVLKKRDAFKDASSWETYVLSECINTIRFTNSLIKNFIRENGIGPHVITCAVEQQRGRVKSIVEAGLGCAALAAGWKVLMPHPLTWKKKIGLPWGGGNASNKQEAVKAQYFSLELYCKENNTPMLMRSNSRIHDLCDAACISEYSRKCRDFTIQEHQSKIKEEEYKEEYDESK
jgi:hypothetical protein